MIKKEKSSNKNSLVFAIRLTRWRIFWYREWRILKRTAIFMVSVHNAAKESREKAQVARQWTKYFILIVSAASCVVSIFRENHSTRSRVNLTARRTILIRWKSVASALGRFSIGYCELPENHIIRLALRASFADRVWMEFHSPSMLPIRYTAYNVSTSKLRLYLCLKLFKSFEALKGHN